MSRKQIVAVLAALAAFASALAGILDAVDSGPAPSTVTYTTANNKKVEAPKSAVAAAASGGERNLVTPRSFLGAERKASRSSDQANPAAPRVSGPVPAASPFQRGCLTRSNTTNFSYRNGTRPSIGVLHLTVAPNRPGWGDINGVAAFLNRASTQASANYIIDNEGHCIYTVAEVFKAWAQAAYNSATACSFEVQNTGGEATYAGTAGLQKLALIVHDCSQRWHIPLRRAVVSGGRVLRSGFIDHFHLAAAGGGHVDIHRFGAGCRNAGPGADTWRCVDLVLEIARQIDGGGSQPVTAAQRGRCQELNRIRRYAKKNAWTLALTRRAQAIKAGEKKHGLTCRFGPPGRLLRA